MGSTDVRIRPATAADLARVVQIEFGSPSDELVGMFGSVDGARTFLSRQLTRDGITSEAAPVVVAERDGQVVGMLQYRHGSTSSERRLSDAVLAVRVLGLRGVLALLPRLRARGRVDHTIPTDAFYIAEVHVDPALRGGGIGGQLVRAAKELAAQRGAKEMLLTTSIGNPAARLYERNGFTVVDTVTDREYERYAGTPGRILMCCPLG